MKLPKYILILLLSLGSMADLQAQSFFGYQTIGIHTFYCALSWQGKPMLGFGYNRRLAGGTPFTDLQAEWHFPLADMYKLQNHQIIAGMYKPLRARRSSLNLGIHARINRQTEGPTNSIRYGVAVSVLPTYTYAASLSNGPYGTIGLRGTYEAVLLARVWDEGDKASADWQALPIHHVELGGHLDLHLERTLGLAHNSVMSRHWAKDNKVLFTGEEDWQYQGNLYIGTTYYLRRN